jgi:hypothetical protein
MGEGGWPTGCPASQQARSPHGSPGRPAPARRRARLRRALVATVGAVAAAQRDDAADFAYLGLGVVPLPGVALWPVRRRPDHPQARGEPAQQCVGMGPQHVAEGPPSFHEIGRGVPYLPLRLEQPVAVGRGQSACRASVNCPDR